MSDSYQAIYDAVRSKIGGVDTRSVIHDALREAFDISHARAMLQEQIHAVGYDMCRPSTLFRPRIFIDGNMWCALYGDNLQDGVAGFGKSPDEAMGDFDKNWHAKLKDRP
jgi:hypothetical protein